MKLNMFTDELDNAEAANEHEEANAIASELQTITEILDIPNTNHNVTSTVQIPHQSTNINSTPSCYTASSVPTDHTVINQSSNNSVTSSVVKYL